MEKIISILILSSCIIACGNKKDPNLTYFEKPEDYNNYIIKEQIELFSTFDEFIHMIENDSIQHLRTAHDKLYQRSNLAVERINKLADFKKNTEFRDKSKELFLFYKNQCETNLKEMMNLIEKDTLLTDEDQLRIEQIVHYFDSTEKKLNDDLIAAQISFAKKFNLELIENN